MNPRETTKANVCEYGPAQCQVLLAATTTALAAEQGAAHAAEGPHKLELFLGATYMKSSNEFSVVITHAY